MNERYLIKLFSLTIILPMFIFGVIGFIVPYVYVVVPVYETNQCWAMIEDH